jgi:replicative superfamily II helicase
MTATDTKAKRERVVHSAREKTEAVLAWWTERRRTSEICRDMKITSNLLSQWQDRAMEGILAALEPRTRSAEDQKPALPAKVERLLARKTAPEAQSRLSRRLTALAQSKETEKPPASGANR